MPCWHGHCLTAQATPTLIPAEFLDVIGISYDVGKQSFLLKYAAYQAFSQAARNGIVACQQLILQARVDTRKRLPAGQRDF